MVKVKINRPAIKNCGGKKKGGCANWAGATKLLTSIKIAA